MVCVYYLTAEFAALDGCTVWMFLLSRLQNADVANFSIYVHSEPGFVFDESTTKSAFFHNRQLKNSIKVKVYSFAHRADY